MAMHKWHVRTSKQQGMPPPHSVLDLIQLASEFNKCKLNYHSSSDPDKRFIDLDLIQSEMMAIDPSFEQKEMESDCERNRQASVEYSKVFVMVIEGLTTISLNKLKSKI
jgi:hypothetical protein